jgi:phage N-6-adenine-methyltransferase
MTMPEQKPGRSKQDYSTPDDFMFALKERFGYPTWDLAASPENTKCDHFYTEKEDSLSKNWHHNLGFQWLNPPYENIEVWAAKCAFESTLRAKIFLLVPASVGSEWYKNWVEPYAYVLGLNPRLSFDGKNPYPKDCILAIYNYGLTGFKTWRWK